MSDIHRSSPAGGDPWPYNPLVTQIRLHSTEIIADTIDRYHAQHGFKANHFDLAVQIMIVACSYTPEEVWLTDGDDVTIAAELVAKGAAKGAAEVLEHAIQHGRVRLNAELIEAIAAEQTARLHDVHTSHREEFDLPEHDGPELSHFPRGGELTALQLTHVAGRDDVYEAVATEKHSATKVVFRPMDLDLSKAYVESFHYLHAARDDDTLAFGAFVEREKMPFAMVSYAAVGRHYKRNILHAAGLDPVRSIELTRAWNSELSPKNTMSMLFAYAHASILRLRQKHGGAQAQAILTAVNPNLGFKGSAFRAVGFGVIGEKPTAFHYIVDRNERRSYIPRRSLPALSELQPDHARIATASIPLLPTKELAVVLSGRSRLKPITDVVYSVSDAEYRRETEDTKAAGLVS